MTEPVQTATLTDGRKITLLQLESKTYWYAITMDRLTTIKAITTSSGLTAISEQTYETNRQAYEAIKKLSGGCSCPDKFTHNFITPCQTCGWGE